ncbi:MAG: histidine kinase dimerization/phosphoacceptor domain -containing protein [Beijerinckiaceae bacterium]|nr:histidine kinase dimerization/phosphoacceptor domain -containing protein [Beijerinckiaceae bacterium]
MKAELHQSEADRLAALRSYGVLDTPRETEFDEIVRVVSEVCEAPISVINLIDEGRQWFKAEVGLGVRETPIDSSLCAHAILQPGLFIVPDTLLDKRFTDNPLVIGNPHLRFYAGALLETADGMPLGTVCMLDYKPRVLTETQKSLLKVMASQVMKTLELRKVIREEQKARQRAERLAEENETLAREGDHRVMNSLQLVQSVISLQIRGAKTPETKIELETARSRVLAIASVHKELYLGGSMEDVEIGGFLHRICDGLKQTAPPQITDVKVTSEAMMLRSAMASSIGLIVAELVTNSFKYAYSGDRRGAVDVALRKTFNGWRLQVSDAGVGFAPGVDVAKGTGVGMRVVNALVGRIGGELHVSSEPGRTVFQIDVVKKD